MRTYLNRLWDLNIFGVQRAFHQDWDTWSSFFNSGDMAAEGCMCSLNMKFQSKFTNGISLCCYLAARILVPRTRLNLDFLSTVKLISPSAYPSVRLLYTYMYTMEPLALRPAVKIGMCLNLRKKIHSRAAGLEGHMISLWAKSLVGKLVFKSNL